MLFIQFLPIEVCALTAEGSPQLRESLRAEHSNHEVGSAFEPMTLVRNWLY